MLLAIDTATATASLALYDLSRDALLSEWTWQARRRHTQDLLCAAQTLLQQAGTDPGALTALAVTTGPGSFTGVRIGISVVKGMAMGLAAPPAIIGLPTLGVTAAPWVGPAARSGATVCACIQAGRGRFNWAYLTADSPHPTVADHHSGTEDDFVRALADVDGALWLAGELTPTLATRAAALPRVVVIDAALGLRRSGALAQVAAWELRAGRTDSLAALQPVYLRAP